MIDHSVDIANPVMMTDSYKHGHWGMLDPETEAMESYGSPRLGARFPVTEPVEW